MGVLAGVVGAAIVTTFVLYARTRIVGCLFLAMAGILQLGGLIPGSLELYVHVLAVGCVGWGYARLLTVDYERLVKARPRWFKGIRGVITDEAVAAEGVPLRRTLTYSFFHLILAFIEAWRRDLFMTFVLALLGVQILLAHLVYFGPRTGRSG